MARHAEVTTEDIIQTGIEIEKTGRMVNPGAIRNKLGAGGFPRIRKVWEEYKKQEMPAEVDDQTIELPTEIADNLQILSSQMQKQLEKMTRSSYEVAMQLAEKRVASTISDYKEKITEFEQFEQDASDSIEKCESQLDKLQEKSDHQEQQINDLKSENIKVQAEIEFSKKYIVKLERKEEELDSLKREYAKLQGKYEVLSQAE